MTDYPNVPINYIVGKAHKGRMPIASDPAEKAIYEDAVSPFSNPCYPILSKNTNSANFIYNYADVDETNYFYGVDLGNYTVASGMPIVAKIRPKYLFLIPTHIGDPTNSVRDDDVYVFDSTTDSPASSANIYGHAKVACVAWTIQTYNRFIHVSPYFSAWRLADLNTRGESRGSGYTVAKAVPYNYVYYIGYEEIVHAGNVTTYNKISRCTRSLINYVTDGTFYILGSTSAAVAYSAGRPAKYIGVSSGIAKPINSDGSDFNYTLPGYAQKTLRLATCICNQQFFIRANQIVQNLGTTTYSSAYTYDEYGTSLAWYIGGGKMSPLYEYFEVFAPNPLIVGRELNGVPVVKNSLNCYKDQLTKYIKDPAVHGTVGLEQNISKGFSVRRAKKLKRRATDTRLYNASCVAGTSVAVEDTLPQDDVLGIQEEGSCVISALIYTVGNQQRIELTINKSIVTNTIGDYATSTTTINWRTTAGCGGIVAANAYAAMVADYAARYDANYETTIGYTQSITASSTSSTQEIIDAAFEYGLPLSLTRTIIGTAEIQINISANASNEIDVFEIKISSASPGDSTYIYKDIT